MTYAETYEARTILDSWRNGDGDEIAVLTIDPDQEAWLHVIDADGIEASRRPENEAAAAVLYRERINPPDEPAKPGAPAVRTDQRSAVHRTEPGFEAPADTLLAAALAWSRATSILTAAIADSGAGVQGVPHGAVEQLTELIEPLTILHAGFSIGSLRRLIAQTEAGDMTAESFAAALDELVARLRDELALIRIVTLAPTRFAPDGEPPFGPLVEQHFPGAGYDIEEAVRCLALRRPTASVSHAMKVMRHGLQAVEPLASTRHLADLSWARMIAAVRSASGGQRDLVEALTRVRRVWRTPGLAPADRYSEEEAEAVLTAVAAFMRVIAARQEEAGETRAG
jgi:hypothetical protein